MLSGMICVFVISHCSAPEKTSSSAGITLSVDGSCEAVSDTTNIPAFSFILPVTRGKVGGWPMFLHSRPFPEIRSEKISPSASFGYSLATIYVHHPRRVA